MLPSRRAVTAPDNGLTSAEVARREQSLGKSRRTRWSAVIPFDEGRRVAATIPSARFVPLESRNHVLLDTVPAWRTLVEAMDRFLPYPASPASWARELTAREREVLAVLALGADNAEIAARLGISEKTARNHLSIIFGKLGVRNRTQAVLLAREVGFGRK